jgi:hypothetical protein
MRCETAELKQFVREYPFAGIEKGQQARGFWTSLKDRVLEHTPMALDSLGTSLDCLAIGSLIINPPAAFGAEASAIGLRTISHTLKLYITNKAIVTHARVAAAAKNILIRSENKLFTHLTQKLLSLQRLRL